MKRFLHQKNALQTVKYRLWSVSLLFLLGSLTNSLFATHIIGGVMSYECLGNGDYRFTMRMYRSCSSDSQAGFPNEAAITIRREDSNVNYPVVVTRRPDLEENNPPQIPLPEIPCLDPPDDVCVEAGTYVFEYNLPVSDKTYHIIFQRCCRNGTISNILTPGDVGVTFAIDLTSEAQAGCNTSPVFNEFPPIVICVNEELEIDQSASDADGDQLVYELCAPLKGGGKAGTQDDPNGDATGCDGFMPDPACPPPFDPVDFIVPTYSATQPMGGDPVVTINPITGLITGIPNVQGQFVVGVCVKEFRNGVLLSTTRRDFQFNVEECDPLIQPVVEADEILDDNTFVINSCGENEVQIVNNSMEEQNIDNFRWEFDIANSVQVFDVWNPLLILPDTGIYEGFLYLNPGTECGDTGRVLVNYFPVPTADFVVSYDTCVAGEVSLINASIENSVPITDNLWVLGNGMTSNEVNPVVDYEIPDSYSIILTVVDEHGCSDVLLKTVDWFPAPELIVIEPSSFVGCPPANIFFNNLTEPINEDYQIDWSFGDGLFSDEYSPTHDYDSVGSYTIDVEIISPLGCLTTRTFTNWINITPEPIANFDFTPQELDNFNPIVQFIDSSLYNNSWYWDFDGEANSYIQKPTHIFQDTGLQVINLVVTHPNGCADSIQRLLDIVPKVTYFLPNAFTPNGDGNNDLFLGKGYLVGMRDFNLEIWNRWGEQIFQTNDPEQGWNGTKFNTGRLSPTGTYQCFVSYTEPRGESVDLQMTLTLIR